MHDYGLMWMGGWGFAQWLMFAAFVTVIAYPVGLVLKRLGFSPLWAGLVFVPVVNIVGLWVVALSGDKAADRQM
jgi:hypothetical protein